LPLQLACVAAVVRATGDAARGLPLLARSLSDPDPAVRKQAVEKIGELGEQAHPALPQLHACLSDPVPDVRAAAALALARVRAPADWALGSLTSLLLNDPAPEVRLNAAIALSGFGGSSAPAVPHLRAAEKDPDANVAAAAHGAIEIIQKPQ
ncbi:MAG: HEAT repeat domain-containing protein, partial [Bryobacteraceae bacterium]